MVPEYQIILDFAVLFLLNTTVHMWNQPHCRNSDNCKILGRKLYQITFQMFQWWHLLYNN